MNQIILWDQETKMIFYFLETLSTEMILPAIHCLIGREYEGKPLWIMMIDKIGKENVKMSLKVCSPLQTFQFQKFLIYPSVNLSLVV
jgi:hypothetical protein